MFSNTLYCSNQLTASNQSFMCSAGRYGQGKDHLQVLRHSRTVDNIVINDEMRDKINGIGKGKVHKSKT